MNSKIKWIVLASLNLVVIGGIFLVKDNSSDIAKESDKLSVSLNNIQAQLINLQNEMKKPSNSIELSSTNQDFNKLATLIEQLKSKDESQLNQLINENRSELNIKLDAIHQVISNLNKKQNPIKYLPTTALPFKVVSIDSIQQVNVASVTYDFKTIPLEKGDILANWRVLHVEFGKQRMELENNNKEHVVVTMETEQGE